MTLKQFLETLVSTKDMDVTLTDLDSGNEIVTFKASGFESLDDAIEAREVKQWSIISLTHVKAVLAAS